MKYVIKKMEEGKINLKKTKYGIGNCSKGND